MIFFSNNFNNYVILSMNNIPSLIQVIDRSDLCEKDLIILNRVRTASNMEIMNEALSSIDNPILLEKLFGQNGSRLFFNEILNLFMSAACKFNYVLFTFMAESYALNEDIVTYPHFAEDICVLELVVIMLDDKARLSDEAEIANYKRSVYKLFKFLAYTFNVSIERQCENASSTFLSEMNACLFD